MSYNPNYSEFFIPGTFDPSEGQPSNEEVLHQGGMDQIDPAYDAVHGNLLAGAIGFDPSDLLAPSIDTQLVIEKELPQWGPPFVKFVDGRISELEKKFDKAIQEWSFKTQTIFLIASMNTDGSGNITANNPNAILYEPPPGWTFALHRIGIFLDGNTFGSPFTGAGDFWELRINNETIEGGSLVSGQGSLPVVKTWGTRDALRVRDGEILSFFAQGLTVNKRLYIKGQGSLDRTIEG